MSEQTFEGWCVFEPYGTCRPHTLNYETQILCWRGYCTQFVPREEWRQFMENLKAQGYTVRPVTVTVKERLLEQHANREGGSEHG
jgi:hypothetical protein